ncbi:hypothetical protein Tco_1444885 [Tanacetum coccineum]
MMKSKRVKRLATKSTKAPARGDVIRETPKMPLSKKKEKVDVARGKGIELLYDVALTEEPQNWFKPRVPDVTEEESSKSETKSWGNDEDDSNNEQDSRSEGSDEENDSDDNNENGSDFKHETDENESDSESDHQENEEEDEDDEEED